ncbi:MAG: hypothetical protein AAGC45_13425 [Bacteroidota bacterium]
MRILRLIPVLFTFVLFVSCSDDDDNTTMPVDQDTLLGTWEMILLNVNTDISGNLDFPITSSTNSVGENLNYTLTFTETNYSASGSYDIVTTGTVNGSPLDEERETVTNVNESGTYELVDGELVIDGGVIDLEDINSELEGAEINPNFEATLNSNGELVIEQNGDISIDVEGAPLDVEYDSRVVFRKL